jgi:GcrA cell cycle regulator
MPVSIGPGWTAERKAELRKLWIAGQSASQIAKHLKVTRNAVIGKVHRLGMSGRAAASAPDRLARVPKVKRDVVRSTNQAKGAIVRKQRQDDVPAPAPKVDLQPIPLTVESPNARPWMERRGGECKWPLGERGAIMSCCNPIWRRDYCEGHARQGYDLTVKRVGKGKGRWDNPSRIEADAVWLARHERQDRVERVSDRKVSTRPSTAWDEARSAA